MKLKGLKALRRACAALSIPLILATLLLLPGAVLAQQNESAADDDDGFAGRRAAQPAPAAAPLEPSAPIPTTVSKMFRAGGLMMYPMVLCSIVMVAFGIERFVVLRRRRVIPHDFVKRFLDHVERGELDRGDALKLCEENGSPIAGVFEHGVRKWGKPAVEVEQAIIDGGERQVSQLRRHLRILNAIATVSPLIGLLGTTIGMITCFNEVSRSAMGKSEQLAGGIGEALISTAGGLLVAIPAIVLYNFFAGKVDSLVMEMDSVSQKLVNLISAEALSPQSQGLPRIARPKTVGNTAVKST
jgi:biopolymer transport protein ExbB